MSKAAEQIVKEISEMDGKLGFYYKNLATEERAGFREKEAFLPASVVKLPLLMGMLLKEARGETNFDDKIVIRDDQKIPGCGAVQHMPGDVELDIRTLYKLMITISDNTATNALLRHYGVSEMRGAFLELGMTGTQFNREYYDFEKENRGIQNYFVPEELGVLLEKMYRRTLISPRASELLENILLQQQINHKLGGRLSEDVPIAHKTGEEDGKTHDVGIIYAKQPFVVCFASNDVNVPVFEDFIRRSAFALYEEANQ